MKKIIRVGTRESKLAMAQARIVANLIKSRHPDIELEILGISTSGDKMLDKRLDTVGGKGLFIKELENALLDNRIDIAVHSMKDIPVFLADGLTIAAVSRREDARDVLVTLDGTSLRNLKKGATVGTSSLRRELQLLEKRPDLRVKTLRGNILTRLDKLLNNEYDALILAAAGLRRLGLEEKCTEYFAVDEMIPAVGQGIIAIEAREGEDVSYLTDSVHSEESALQLEAERAFMIKLNGGCSTPVAAHAVTMGESMRVYGMYASLDKPHLYKEFAEGSKYDAARLGERLADKIIEKLGR